MLRRGALTLNWRAIEAAAARMRRLAPAEATLFWDGACPLCRREIAYYKWLDSGERRVEWIDVQAEPERLEAHGVTLEAALARIHGLDRRGALLVGMPAFLAVWEVLPYWRLLPPIVRSLPFAMPLIDRAYAWWAKRRLGISARVRALEEGSACRRK